VQVLVLDSDRVAPYCATMATTLPLCTTTAVLLPRILSRFAALAGDDIADLTDEQKRQFHQHELNSLSKNSVRTYTSDLRVFTAWMKEHYPEVDDLRLSTWPQIGLWMQSMADDGISEATIKRRLSFLRSHLVPSLKLPEVELQYQKAFKGLVKSSHTDEPKGKRALMDNNVVDILVKLDEEKRAKCRSM